MSATLVVGGVITGIAVIAVSATVTHQYSNQPEYAQVLYAKPTMQSVAVSREECRDEVVTYKRDPKDSNKIIGTVAGGYAGNRIQEAMQDKDTYQTTERVCTTVQGSKMQQVGYDVIYQLDGHEQELHMNYIPDSRIPVVDGQLVLKN